jgi:Ca-activated chloride channel family protein
MTTRLVAASVVVLIGGAVAPSAQHPTFSAKRESVRVDVLVTDRGKVVTGLGASDFEVRDNGIPQTIDLVSFQEIPLNVFLAFDVSASVSGERLMHLQNAGHALLDRLAKDDRSALLTFSHTVLLREGLTGATARVRQALTDVQPLGDTALIDGAYATLMLDPQDGGRNLLLIFSDGLDTASWLTPEGVLDSAKRSAFVVYGVSSRGPEDSKFLEDLTELTGGTTLKIESTRDLSATFLKILDEFRQRYLISYSPTGVANSGWHRLEVRVKGRRVAVKSRAGYQAGA